MHEDRLSGSCAATGRTGATRNGNGEGRGRGGGGRRLRLHWLQVRALALARVLPYCRLAARVSSLEAPTSLAAASAARAEPTVQLVRVGCAVTGGE